MLAELFGRPRRGDATRRRPVRLAVDRLDDRAVPAALAFNFTYDAALANNAAVQRSVAAAGELLSQHVFGAWSGASVALNVRVTSVDTVGGPLARGGSSYWDTGRDTSGPSPRTIVESIPDIKATTGAYPAGYDSSRPDMTLEVNRYYLTPHPNTTQFYLDPTGFYRGGVVPANQVDLVSTVLHELVHGLGVGGYRDPLQNNGAWTNATFATEYDTFLSPAAGGWVFAGANAAAANGGAAVPVETAQPGSNYYHVANPSDLMYFQAKNGTEEVLSPVTAGILEDLGFDYRTIVEPTGTADFVGGAKNTSHTVRANSTGVWRYTDPLGWTRVTAEAATVAAVNDGGDVVASYAGKVWLLPAAAGAWTELSAYPATTLAINNAGTVVGGFPSSNPGVNGTWRWTGAHPWAKLSDLAASSVVVNDAGSVAGAFDGSGVWWLAAGQPGWLQLSAATAATTVAINNGNTIVAGFNGGGVWRWTPTDGWSHLSTLTATAVAVNDGGVVAGAFGGSGTWVLRAGAPSWDLISSVAVSSVDIRNNGDVLVGLGAVGIWDWVLSGPNRVWIRL